MSTYKIKSTKIRNGQFFAVTKFLDYVCGPYKTLSAAMRKGRALINLGKTSGYHRVHSRSVYILYEVKKLSRKGK